MADPYATRTPDLSGRPDGPPPWLEEVTGAGGVVIDSDGGLGGGKPSFAVVPCCGIGTLAPLARVDPAMAVLLWLEHVATDRDGAAANRLLIELSDFGGPILAVKQGSVGGPADRPGCSVVTSDLVVHLLRNRDGIAWEADPDFAYDVPGSVPGLTDPEARILLPRLLYADHDRVYEHAGLVADKKRERHEIAAAVDGLDPTVSRVADWPPHPTSGEWRD